MYMTSRFRLASLILSLFIFSVAAHGEERVHVLKQGETIYGIGQKYHVPAEAIMELNGIKDPSRLKPGQKIRIPDLYYVKKGDTLYGIARNHGIAFQDLIDANGLDKNAMIKVGDTLYLPSFGTGAVEITKTPGDSAKTGTGGAVTLPGDGSLPARPLEDPRTFESKKVDSSIIWPVSSTQISYLSGKVFGVSIVGAQGENVKAIASGTVVSTGPYRGFGQVVFIQAKSGYIYVYGGLDSDLPVQGATMTFGDSVGTLGSDSLSGKPLLYFMVYNKDVPIDPAKAPRGY